MFAWKSSTALLTRRRIIGARARNPPGQARGHRPRLGPGAKAGSLDLLCHGFTRVADVGDAAPGAVDRGGSLTGLRSDNCEKPDGPARAPSLQPCGKAGAALLGRGGKGGCGAAGARAGGHAVRRCHI